MWIIKLIFVLLIIVPVVIVMFMIFRNLTGEYNAAIRRERNIKNGKYSYSRNRER